MIRVIVAEDEPLARTRIARMLKSDPEVDLVAECSAGLDTVNAVRKCRPDLIFLDVQMPELNGFQILESLEEAEIPHVIFVTAFEQYALRAFELYALDYLLKPFNEARLVKALNRAKLQVEKTNQNEMQKRLIHLLEDYRSEPGKLNRILIKEDSRAWFLKVEDIDWIETETKHVRIQTGTKSYLQRRSLQQLERDLSPDKFVRIHRSMIVNLDRIQEIQTLPSGEMRVKLIDGTFLPVSRSYRKNLRSE
jgi:two-component system LytT family response regulator